MILQSHIEWGQSEGAEEHVEPRGSEVNGESERMERLRLEFEFNP